jgi:hypothetical protein
MTSTVKVIDLFKTSIGEVAVLAFFGDARPNKGMILKDKLNVRWKFLSMGTDKKAEQIPTQ